MSGTIEEFDDDTDFALPVSTVPSGGASGDDDERIRMTQMEELMRNMQAGESSGMMGGSNTAVDAALSAEAKKWISVYPIYFDAKRKYMKGCRRVAHETSCLWPKSTFIEAAAARLTLMYAHESHKTHPQDWENPGRVKVQLFDENGKPKNKSIQSKKALLNAVAAIIQPQCGGKPPPLTKRIPNVDAAKVVPKPVIGKEGGPPVNNKNAASRLGRKGRRVSRKVKPEDRIKGSRPPPLSARYPLNSPAREAGVLNTDIGGMMGGLQGMGPLGAMMGQMGMGGDDDEEAEAEAARLKEEEEEKKKKKDPMQQLSRRQKKRVVRIGR